QQKTLRGGAAKGLSWLRGRAANVITTIFPACLCFPVSPRLPLKVCPARGPWPKGGSGIFRKRKIFRSRRKRRFRPVPRAGQSVAAGPGRGTGFFQTEQGTDL